MNPQKLSTREILERNLERTPPKVLGHLKVWIHDIRSLYNVGAVFRSADAFGISELLLSGITPTPPRAEITKTAIGAEEYVAWRYGENFDEIMEYLKEYNYEIAALEHTDASIPLPEFDALKRQKLCLLFGNEVTGIDDELLSMADCCIEIPQFGHKHSLNIAVSVGAVLYSILEKSWK